MFCLYFVGILDAKPFTRGLGDGLYVNVLDLFGSDHRFVLRGFGAFGVVEAMFTGRFNVLDCNVGQDTTTCDAGIVNNN